jgi:hypothetical protein
MDNSSCLLLPSLLHTHYSTAHFGVELHVSGCGHHQFCCMTIVIAPTQCKLNNSSLTISKADKGKTLEILPLETYKNKIHDFLKHNQFINLNTNPLDQ